MKQIDAYPIPQQRQSVLVSTRSAIAAAAAALAASDGEEIMDESDSFSSTPVDLTTKK